MSGYVAAIDSVLEAVWSVLGTGLIHGTVLVAITALLSVTVLRRAAPALMTALWTVVLVKFVIPIGPEVPVSMSALVSAALSTGDSGAAVGYAAASGALDATNVEQLSLSGALWLLAQIGLLLAYVVLVARRLLRHVRSHNDHRRWAESLELADAHTQAVATVAGNRVGFVRVPSLRVTDDIAAPELVGLIRPLLIVPRHLTENSVRLEAALVHELAHVRRRDPWLRVLQLAVGALFFFWPVVGWVNRRIDDHREMACDQWAITWGRLGAGDYARTLVALARRACDGASSTKLSEDGLALGIVTSRASKQLQTRVQSLMSRPARPRMGALSALCLAMWALVSLGGTGSAHADLPLAPECTIEPGVVEYILSAFPEADIDGDGALSRDEVCAHQKRMKELTDVDMSEVGDDMYTYDASVDLERLGCAACGECGDDDDTVAQSLTDKKMCTGDTVAR